MSPGSDLLRLVRRVGAGWGPAARRRHPTAPRNGSTLHAALRRARLDHAFFQTETLIMLVLTMTATAYVWLNAGLSLPSWSWAAVLCAGLGATAVVGAAALTDPESIKAAIAAALADRLDIDGIADEGVHGQIAQAVAHRAAMEEVGFGGGSRTRGLVSETLVAVDEWLSGMGRLALRLELLQSELRLQSETISDLHDRIGDLEQRIGESTDARITDQLRETLAGRRRQLCALDELENLIERGRLRLEHAVAALSTIHTQLAVLAAREDESGDGAALAYDINAETREIDAMLVALDRVHAAAARRFSAA